MKPTAAKRYRIIFTCFSVFFIIFFLGLSGCATVQQQPTAMDCAAVDAKALQGVVKGKWKGIALNAADIYGEFEVTLSPDGKIKGNYTGAAWGDIAGCIDASGNIQAGGIGSSGKITWIGNVSKSKGIVFASGTWEFASGNGTWSGQKQ